MNAFVNSKQEATPGMFREAVSATPAQSQPGTVDSGENGREKSAVHPTLAANLDSQGRIIPQRGW